MEYLRNRQRGLETMFTEQKKGFQQKLVGIRTFKDNKGSPEVISNPKLLYLNGITEEPHLIIKCVRISVYSP